MIFLRTNNFLSVGLVVTSIVDARINLCQQELLHINETFILYILSLPANVMAEDRNMNLYKTIKVYACFNINQIVY